MQLLILSLILFIGLHLIRVIVPDFRRSMIDKLGKPVWGAVHGILSIVTLLFLAYAFDQARGMYGTLYNPPIWMAHITLTLMLIAMICLVAGFLPAGHIRAKLKFPLLVAIKIWALSHLLANGEPEAIVLFVAFLAWAVLLRISMKQRLRNGEITLPVFVSAKYDLYAVIIGAVLWAVILFKLHELVIGVSPLVM
ncbi:MULTISPECIES: NnrU family protein [unclassified Rhizobium]|uniref:NnrU family protein n=1 Tax=unclassified Rhizobium TaxID=2613769 RepID=UPI000DDADF45|nr:MULTISPECIES: NnrU family protein [unclassified Rhizobium]MBO9125117.1 NnrU family protein [Rhizobium sp. 16-488-2b]MBO9175702.1 NnrU family protein [Rhizobium sp. 16-488-2a]